MTLSRMMPASIPDRPSTSEKTPSSARYNDCLRRLQEDSERLFSASKVAVEELCWTAETDYLRATTSFINNETALEAALESSESVSDVLLQRNTHSSLDLTMNIFLRLFEFCGFSHLFLDFVHGFGYKTSAVDENFNCYYRQSRSPKSYEFCYNIRYAAKNGRKTGNPWSIRHTAICERYDATSKTTRWILIQPSESFKSQALEYINSGSSRPNGLGLHILLLLSSATHWREYINDLENKLDRMEEKALFSRVETFTPGDFDLTFSDVQEIQLLRKKMLKLQAILKASLDLSASFKTHAIEIDDPSIDRSWLDDSILSQVDIHMAQLRCHCRTVSMQLEHSEGISKVLFQILQQRNSTTLVKNNEIMAKATIAMSLTNEGIHNNGEVMKRLTFAARAENEALNHLAEESHRDSRFVKILTFVALLYLPASLIAAIFSSGLVERGAGGHFEIATQFWMFPVFTLALTVFTILAAVLWYRTSQKAHQSTNAVQIKLQP